MRAPTVVRAPSNGLLQDGSSHDDDDAAAIVVATAAAATDDDDRAPHSSSHGELLRAHQATVRRLESQARTMALELSQLRVRNEMLLAERDQYRRRSRAGEERLAALQSEMGEIKDEREYVRAEALESGPSSAQRELSVGTGKGDGADARRGSMRSLFGGPRPPGRVCSMANLDRLVRGGGDVVVSASDAPPLRRTPFRASTSLLGGSASSSRSLSMSEIREGHQHASGGHAAEKPGGSNTSANATWDADPATTTTTTQATEQARTTTTPPQLKAKKRRSQSMNFLSSSGGGSTATTGSSQSSQRDDLVRSNSFFFRGSNHNNNNDRGGGQQSNRTARPKRRGSAAGAVASALWSNITGTPTATEHAEEAGTSQQENTAPNSGAAVPVPPTTGSSGRNRQRENKTLRRRSTIPVRGNANDREAEERRAKEEFAAWQKDEARRCSYLGWGEDAGGAADDQSLASLACPPSWDADASDDADHNRSISTIDRVDGDLRRAEELERLCSGDRRNQDTIDEQMRRAVQEMHASLSTAQDGGGGHQKKKASIHNSSSRNYHEEAHCGFLSWEETKLARSGSASTLHDHISPQWSGEQQAEDDDGGRNCHHDNSGSSTPTSNNVHAARSASNYRLEPEETPAQDDEHEPSLFGGDGTHGGDTQKDVASFLARVQSSLHLDTFEQDNKKKSTPTAADDSIPTNIVPIRNKVAPRSSRQNNKKKSREGITFL